MGLNLVKVKHKSAILDWSAVVSHSYSQDLLYKLDIRGPGIQQRIHPIILHRKVIWDITLAGKPILNSHKRGVMAQVFMINCSTILTSSVCHDFMTVFNGFCRHLKKSSSLIPCHFFNAVRHTVHVQYSAQNEKNKSEFLFMQLRFSFFGMQYFSDQVIMVIPDHCKLTILQDC